eukprot:TRINITY_DN532_c0_g1_i5.p2 TRINITY_DN532_c0_g1~~TRINITY_DN532_c0_g1_i5.p2  ORF type:complete len:161 (+),score=34.45 TRINITY_DN532_c0_g1_i5:65-484(+)
MVATAAAAEEESRTLLGTSSEEVWRLGRLGQLAVVVSMVLAGVLGVVGVRYQRLSRQLATFEARFAGYEQGVLPAKMDATQQLVTKDCSDPCATDSSYMCTEQDNSGLCCQNNQAQCFQPEGKYYTECSAGINCKYIYK